MGYGVFQRRRDIVGALLAVLIIGTVVGLFIGAIAGEHHQQFLLYVERRDTIAPVLAKDPAFRSVRIEELSIGGVCFAGYVSTQADKKRLLEITTALIGERRAAAAVTGISVGEDR